MTNEDIVVGIIRNSASYKVKNIDYKVESEDKRVLVYRNDEDKTHFHAMELVAAIKNANFDCSFQAKNNEATLVIYTR